MTPAPLRFGSRRLLGLLLTLLGTACAGPRPEPAQLLFRGGPIHTLEPPENGHAPATALAVTDGRIVWVGDEDDAERCYGPETRVITLDGRAVCP